MIVNCYPIKCASPANFINLNGLSEFLLFFIAFTNLELLDIVDLRFLLKPLSSLLVSFKSEYKVSLEYGIRKFGESLSIPLPRFDRSLTNFILVVGLIEWSKEFFLWIARFKIFGVFGSEIFLHNVMLRERRSYNERKLKFSMI